MSPATRSPCPRYVQRRPSTAAGTAALPTPRQITTLEMLRAAKPRAAQHLECVRAARAGAAVENEIAIARNRVDVPFELAEGNEPCAFEVALLELVVLADIDQ